MIDQAGNRPLDRDQLESLIVAGLIGEQDRDRVRAEFRQSIDWSSWLGRWALGLGALFFACGVVFFFAYNWKSLSPLARFASLEAGVALAVVVTLFVGIESLFGRWLLFGASIIAGVLVAVYGQVYQTGADAFEVFALWATLIFAWVLVGRFAPLWLLWLVVAETALILFWGQVMVPDGIAGWDAGIILVGLFTVSMAALRTWLLAVDGERFAWLRGAWLRFVLLVVALYSLSMEPMRLIFDFGRSNDNLAASMGTLVWLCVLALCAWFYFSIRPSVAALGLCALALATVLALAVGRVILEDNFDAAGAWLVVGVAVIGIFGAMGWLITRAGRLIREREDAASVLEKDANISTEAQRDDR